MSSTGDSAATMISSSSPGSPRPACSESATIMSSSSCASASSGTSSDSPISSDSSAFRTRPRLRRPGSSRPRGTSQSRLRSRLRRRSRPRRGVQLSPCVRRPHRVCTACGRILVFRLHVGFPSLRRFRRRVRDRRLPRRSAPASGPDTRGSPGRPAQTGSGWAASTARNTASSSGIRPRTGTSKRLRDRVDRAVVCGGRGVGRVIATPATEPPSRSVSWRVFSVSPRALPLRRRDEESRPRARAGAWSRARARAGVHKHVVGVVERGDDLPEPEGRPPRTPRVRRAGDDAEAGRTCVNRVGGSAAPASTS